MLFGFQLLRKLALVERRVEAALGEQRFVIALLDHVAVLHNQNHIRALDGGQAVRDDAKAS